MRAVPLIHSVKTIDVTVAKSLFVNANQLSVGGRRGVDFLEERNNDQIYNKKAEAIETFTCKVDQTRKAFYRGQYLAFESCVVTIHFIRFIVAVYSSIAHLVWPERHCFIIRTTEDKTIFFPFFNPYSMTYGL